MKRKAPPADAPVPEEILKGAQPYLVTEKPRTEGKCTVCGAETTSEEAERLCWVCRRLKISAWRDVEQQMPVQE